MLLAVGGMNAGVRSAGPLVLRAVSIHDGSPGGEGLLPTSRISKNCFPVNFCPCCTSLTTPDAHHHGLSLHAHDTIETERCASWLGCVV